MKRVLIMVLMMLIAVMSGCDDSSSSGCKTAADCAGGEKTQCNITTGACISKDVEKANAAVTRGEQAFDTAFDVVREEMSYDSYDGDFEVDDSKNLIEKADFTAAKEAYKEAISFDQDNYRAQLFAAATELLSLTQTDEFKTLWNAWQIEPDFDNATDLKAKLTLKPMLNKIDASLQFALERLEFLSSIEGLTITITPEVVGMDGDDFDPVEIDQADIALFRAVLTQGRAVIALYTAYELELEQYTLQGLIDGLNQQTGKLLTLSDPEKMDRALSLANEGFTLAINGFDLLLAEQDSQNDDLIHNRNQDGIKRARSELLKWRNALSNQIVVDISSTTSITIDIPAFFNNPPQDLKKLLFDYIVYEKDGKIAFKLPEGKTFSEIDFPDYTFGGLLPDHTKDLYNKPVLNHFFCEDRKFEQMVADCDWDYIYICNGSDCNGVVEDDDTWCWGSDEDRQCCIYDFTCDYDSVEALPEYCEK